AHRAVPGAVVLQVLLGFVGVGPGACHVKLSRGAVDLDPADSDASNPLEVIEAPSGRGALLARGPGIALAQGERVAAAGLVTCALENAASRVPTEVLDQLLAQVADRVGVEH